MPFFFLAVCVTTVASFDESPQDAAAAMSELELLFKYLDAMGTLKVNIPSRDAPISNGSLQE